MADTLDEILKQAVRLGELIRQHPRYARLREADDAIRADQAATGALQAYNQAAAKVAKKERALQPVEVAEKQELQRLQETVAANERVKVFMAAQADYAEMMRRMNDTIFDAITGDDDKAESPPPTARP
jgi:cell fate (sporulation/competence/biofilm development) regulator YlbF (YheA/YmcA/DUF963 family)